MTPRRLIKSLIKAGVTAEGVLGADRLKKWKAKHFHETHKFYKGPPHVKMVGVKLSVTEPKSKAQLPVEIRWKGKLWDMPKVYQKASKEEESFPEDVYVKVLRQSYSKYFEKEFNVSIGSKKYNGVRGDQLAALIDAVLCPTPGTEVVRLKKKK